MIRRRVRVRVRITKVSLSIYHVITVNEMSFLQTSRRSRRKMRMKMRIYIDEYNNENEV